MNYKHKNELRTYCFFFRVTAVTLSVLTFYPFEEYLSFLFNCREKAVSNVIALGMKQMFASRWMYPEIICASFRAFYASESGLLR